jgi:TfoX/Sxy family transcriptional regulator of competence genes
MSLNEDFKDFILDQFDGLGQFETKRMFGRVTLLYKGLAFAKIKH